MRQGEARCCPWEWWCLDFKHAFDNHGSSTPQGFILTPSQYEEYLCLTQVATFAPLQSLPKLVMSLHAFHIHMDHGFLILEPLIIFPVIRTFFLLTFTSLLPMVTLANEPQTIAKGIHSTCPLSLPLSILYVPDSPFNLISISKLTLDLNCLFTFSNYSITLQDQNTRRTIGIGHESQGLFHLNSPSCSTVCTFTNTPLLIHSHLGHPNLSKFRRIVPHLSSLASLECDAIKNPFNIYVLCRGYKEPL